MAISSMLLIGGGNMGAALASCWERAFPKTRLVIAEADADRRKLLRQQGLDAPDTVPSQDFEIVVLAIKPQTFVTLPKDMITRFTAKATLVSIMAGVKLDTLRALCPHVARVMPNTPAIIGEGMSAICAPGLDNKRLEQVKSLFSVTGKVAVIDAEEEMHAITALSGSGPAYVFAFMEALEAAAIQLGLDLTTARALVKQTCKGAVLLADKTSGELADLRRQVTSPGGTTEAALKVMEGKLNELVLQAVEAAKTRSQSMS